MNVLINPRVRWAVHPADQGRITQIDGQGNVPVTLPQEGDVITLDYLVDPQTRRPVPVRVVEIRTLWKEDHHVLAIVVSRHH